MAKKAIIFGAGASIGAVPIVSDMVDHIGILVDYIRRIEFSDDDYSEACLELIQNLEYVKGELQFAMTPDAVLNSIYQNPSLNFDQYLRSFWIYLLLVQFVDRKELGMFDLPSKRKYNFIDRRYYELISDYYSCLLYTSPSPRDQRGSRMPSSA